MVWKIEFDKAVEKQLRKLSHQAQEQILDYLEEHVATLDNPRLSGKSLKGEFSGFWRYRVGNYRIICKIEDKNLVVLVVKAGHRRDVYD